MDYRDKKYNKLTLLAYSRPGGMGVGAIWRALCDCGNTLEVLARKVRAGAVQSCGNCEKGIGIQGSGRLVGTGIPAGHYLHFKKLLKQKPDAQLRAQDYRVTVDRDCCICASPDVRVEWGDLRGEPTATNLIAICGECSKWRRGINVLEYLRYLVKVTRRINNMISRGYTPDNYSK